MDSDDVNDRAVIDPPMADVRHIDRLKLCIVSRRSASMSTCDLSTCA